MSLPSDYKARKNLPICTGVLDYFPDALAAVCEASLAGNKQHLDGEPLHWDKSKSSDEADALLRHLVERGTVDTDGVRHSAKVAWRALALLQREIDAEARIAAATKTVLDEPSVKELVLNNGKAYPATVGWYDPDEYRLNMNF